MVIQHHVDLPTDVYHAGGALRITTTGSLTAPGSNSLWTTAPFVNAGSVSLNRLVLLDAAAWTDSLVNTGTIATTRMAMRRAGRNAGVITAIDSLVFDRSSFRNDATVSSRVTWVRDSLVWNQGLFISYDLVVDSTGLFHNLGTCRVLAHLAVRSSGNFNVATGAVETRVLGDADIRWGLNVWDAHMQVDGWLRLDDAEVPIPHLTFFTAGGSIHTRHFRNEGWAAGPGTLCIADSSENLGLLHPDLILCDATPTTNLWPYLDLNTGTVDPGVVVCPAGSCTVGIGSPEAVAKPRLIHADGAWWLTGLPQGPLRAELIDMAGRAWPLSLEGNGDTRRVVGGPTTGGPYHLRLVFPGDAAITLRCFRPGL